MNIIRLIKYYKKYFFNKNKLNLLKQSWLGYPYDYHYFYEIQLYKLIEMKNYFKDSKYTYRNKDIEREIKLAISLLNLFLYEKNDKYPDGISDYDYKTKELNFKPYLNKRNLYRFISEIKNINKWPEDELYKLKVIYMYHKLCLYKAHNNWWD